MKKKLKCYKQRRAKQRKKRPRGYIRMQKILLVEDRPQRQANFLEKQQIDLSPFSDRLINCAEDEHKHLIEDINNGNIDWTQYSTIILHRSGFKPNILDLLKEVCKNNSIKLVFFSGGISSTFYTDTPYEFLQLNSKDLYTKNFKLFLETNVNNLLQLAYGKEWEVNILLNKLERINKFIENDKLNKNKDIEKVNKLIEEGKLNKDEGIERINKLIENREKVYFSSFSTEINIDLIQNLIQNLTIEVEKERDIIKVKELERIKKKILDKIKMKAILND